MSTQTIIRQRNVVSETSTLTSSSIHKSTQISVHGRKVKRVPTSKPPFTVADIRRAIPAHCFEKSLVTSFAYLSFDILLIITLGIAANQISMLPSFVQPILWVFYWIAQGSVMTGAWVIGHECGHGGFAPTTLMNDIVGFIVHSALFVPYFSWQISHRKHHSNTGSLERDEVFVPREAPADYQPEEESDLTIVHAFRSISRSVLIAFMLTFGWPLYLLTNVTGNKSYPNTISLNHFTPSSPIYADIKAGPLLIALSDVGLITVTAIAVYLCQVYSFINVAAYYILPLLVTNLFLVLITFLQHTDHSLPHYDASEWDWLRGALATVDRDYGILNHIFHHISDTHVVHHLFSSMPHYHAQEATEAVKGLLGEYYLFDDTPIVTALWRSYGECNVVKQDSTKSGIYWFAH